MDDGVTLLLQAQLRELPEHAIVLHQAPLTHLACRRVDGPDGRPDQTRAERFADHLADDLRALQPRMRRRAERLHRMQPLPPSRVGDVEALERHAVLAELGPQVPQAADRGPQVRLLQVQRGDHDLPVPWTTTKLMQQSRLADPSHPVQGEQPRPLPEYCDLLVERREDLLPVDERDARGAWYVACPDRHVNLPAQYMEPLV
ncbi:hypothetical protein [Myceligenerans halotolerans]